MSTRPSQERASPGSASAGEDDPDRLYTIGELAEELDITTRTIRFYEAKGLILPARRGVARRLIPRAKRPQFPLHGRKIVRKCMIEHGPRQGTHRPRSLAPVDRH